LARARVGASAHAARPRARRTPSKMTSSTRAFRP
jgi:hypothetical protein